MAANSTRGGSDIVTVSWSNAVLDDDSSMMYMLAALGLTVVIGLAVAIRLASANPEDDDREVNRDSSDEERVDLFATMMDEEDA